MTALRLHDLDQFRAVRLPPHYPSNVRDLAAPVDQVHDALLAIVNSAVISIYAALFDLTDVQLVTALLARADAGVPIQLTLDSTESITAAESVLIPKLTSHVNVDLSVGTSEHGAYMHLKDLVVDGLLVATGSVNWTTSGESAQDNRLIVIANTAVATEVTGRLTAIHAYQKAHTPPGAPR